MPVHVLQPSWPAALLPVDPPAVDDAQSAPITDEILRQILPLTPRGPAWGTDEAGNPGGVSPVMRQLWRAIAGWTATLNIRDFEAASQAVPSLVTIALADWEAELGMPGPGETRAVTTAGRLAAIRMLLQGLTGTAPADYIGLCAKVGASVSIEEPDQFQVDATELGPAFDDPAPAQSDLDAMAPLSDTHAGVYWLVTVLNAGPFGTAAALQSVLGRVAPLHTRLVFIP